MLGPFQRLGRSVPGRLVLALLALVALAIPYPFLNASLAPRLDLMTPLDRAIPFLPWTVLVYSCWLVLPACAAALSSAEAFPRLLGGLAGCALCCYLGFVLLPAHYPRPELPASFAGFHSGLRSIDGPGNTFPSLHVAVTAFSGLRLRTHRLRGPFLAAAAAVALSTLTTKQHFVLDLLGGAGVALALELATGRLGRARGPS